MEAESQETFQVSDIAELLAPAWREEHQELNRLQKNRQIGKAMSVVHTELKSKNLNGRRPVTNVVRRATGLVSAALPQPKAMAREMRVKRLLLTMHRQVLPWPKLCHRALLPWGHYPLYWIKCVCGVL